MGIILIVPTIFIIGRIIVRKTGDDGNEHWLSSFFSFIFGKVFTTDTHLNEKGPMKYIKNLLYDLGLGIILAIITAGLLTLLFWLVILINEKF